MKAIFNSRSIDTSEPALKITNRAFCYGDGLFETIVTGPNRINLIERHYKRLQEGAMALGMTFPKELTLERLNYWIKELINQNSITDTYRVRIHLWRDSGGQYTPLKKSSSYLIEIENNHSQLVTGDLSIGLNTEYVNTFSPISRFKSKNALKYVMLGKIREERGLDDIILIDNHGNLSESFTSSLFWAKGNKIYTPGLETGCVSGVMRSFIMEYMKDTDNPIDEVFATHSTLESCDAIFTSNGAGIKWYNRFESKDLVSPMPLLENLVKRLQQP